MQSCIPAIFGDDVVALPPHTPMRCWAQHLRPDSTVWPYHTYCIWPCQARQKYSCTVRSIIGLQQSPPQMKSHHGLNEEKTIQEKNSISIELSEVNVWLVWIVTTKHKSLKRVETCQKKHFNFWLFCYVNSVFQNYSSNGFYSLDIYILLICSADCSFIFEWRCSDLGYERIPRLCLADCTRTPYSFCLLKVCDHNYWPTLSSNGYDHQ